MFVPSLAWENDAFYIAINGSFLCINSSKSGVFAFLRVTSIAQLPSGIGVMLEYDSISSAMLHVPMLPGTCSYTSLDMFACQGTCGLNITGIFTPGCGFTTEEKRSFFGAFPMFVPSLSWQNVRFYV
jgi:hypothetical protein